MNLNFGQLLQGFGAGAQAMGAYGQSKASSASRAAANRAEAQVALGNARLAGWQAEDAIDRGEAGAFQVQQRGAQMKGSQRAAMAANGVDLGVGSALQVITDTDYLASVDATTVANNAAREAWGYRIQQAQYGAKGVNNLTAAGDIEKNASSDAWLAAGTSLVGSATQVAASWYKASTNAGTRDGYSDWAYKSNRGMGDK